MHVVVIPRHSKEETRRRPKIKKALEENAAASGDAQGKTDLCKRNTRLRALEFSGADGE